jgi:hypothetical protein
MKLHNVALLAIAVSVPAIGLASIASADVTDQQTQRNVSVHQTPGNAQITAIPGAAAHEAARDQLPFGGASGALLFHH